MTPGAAYASVPPREVDARRHAHRPDVRGLLSRKVLAIDRNDLVLVGLRTLLELQPWVRRCATTTDPASALIYAERFAPHVVLLDLALVDESSGSLPRELLTRAPEARILLATAASRLSPARTRQVGAAGWVAKDWSARDLVRAVRLAADGSPVPPPSRLHDVRLSEREREVLALMAAGATNREIATRLYLSPHTVKTHGSALYRKLEARNRAEAVTKAQRFGLID